MATIKSFSDLNQSKVLAKILPLESADMYWDYDVQKHEHYPMVMDDQFDDTCIRAWSLAALLNVLPKIGAKEPMVRKLYYASKPVERYICEYSLTNMTSEYDNPIDACYEMILKLHKMNLL